LRREKKYGEKIFLLPFLSHAAHLRVFEKSKLEKAGFKNA